MMMISEFSGRTGIPASALRFYHRKGLLEPARRLPNGYRAYAPEQVEEAKLINSLREVGVSIADIQEFLRQDESNRRRLLAQWRREVADRLVAIRIANQYLHGLTPEEPQIHLQRWEEPSVLLWFPATAPPQPLAFAPAVAEQGRRLERLGVATLGGGFVRSVDVQNGRLIGEVGFRVKPGRQPAAVRAARVQEVPPTLFATLECTIEDETAAHRVFRFLHDFGLAPSGLYLERYLPGTADRYEIMLAVEQINT
jgi:DNA-binding transcriptional MerR regulator